ncbi:Patatin-related protein [Parasponia andersonii]|uniref:Patatin n=1 Tax=Parasponia andersonii TaxID=3476 RepID=A0A2P5B9W2_PARAD|nr:Patatin-related protein [Parasponia andersonii]
MERTNFISLPPRHGSKITILSIDGGGIRGIIPSVILQELERILEDRDSSPGRKDIAQYFDVITGTSTGGLITAMLTCPDPRDPKRPKFSALDIVQFYRNEASKIFPQINRFPAINKITKPLNALFGPKYSGSYLRKLAKDRLGETRLDQVLTNVVIPAFDIYRLQPKTFSRYQVNRNKIGQSSGNNERLPSINQESNKNALSSQSNNIGQSSSDNERPSNNHDQSPTIYNNNIDQSSGSEIPSNSSNGQSPNIVVNIDQSTGDSERPSNNNCDQLPNSIVNIGHSSGEHERPSNNTVQGSGDNETAQSSSDDGPALLSDICIATSAAPTYLPAQYFEVNGNKYNLIDGGVAANNPTFLALSEVVKNIGDNKEEYPKEINPFKCTDLLVLSLGTGSPKNTGKFNAKSAAKWGMLRWLSKGGSTPIIDVFSEASVDMVDIYLRMIFRHHGCESCDGNYLRIQDPTLSNDLYTVDIATEDNMKRLKKEGKELLQENVSRVNLETGEYYYSKNRNSTALRLFADKLIEERNLRRKNMKSPTEQASTSISISTSSTSATTSTHP